MGITCIVEILKKHIALLCILAILIYILLVTVPVRIQEGFGPIIPTINGHYRPLVRTMRKSHNEMARKVKISFNKLSRQILGISVL